MISSIFQCFGRAPEGASSASLRNRPGVGLFRGSVLESLRSLGPLHPQFWGLAPLLSLTQKTLVVCHWASEPTEIKKLPCSQSRESSHLTFQSTRNTLIPKRSKHIRLGQEGHIFSLQHLYRRATTNHLSRKRWQGPRAGRAGPSERCDAPMDGTPEHSDRRRQVRGGIQDCRG